MPQSLRRQKILLERELQKSVENCIYSVDDKGNYRLRVPFPKINTYTQQLKKQEGKLEREKRRHEQKKLDREIEQFRGFPDTGTQEYYRENLLLTLPIKEFYDDEVPNWKLD